MKTWFTKKIIYTLVSGVWFFLVPSIIFAQNSNTSDSTTRLEVDQSIKNNVYRSLSNIEKLINDNDLSSLNKELEKLKRIVDKGLSLQIEDFFPQKIGDYKRYGFVSDLPHEIRTQTKSFIIKTTYTASDDDGQLLGNAIAVRLELYTKLGDRFSLKDSSVYCMEKVSIPKIDFFCEKLSSGKVISQKDERRTILSYCTPDKFISQLTSLPYRQYPLITVCLKHGYLALRAQGNATLDTMKKLLKAIDYDAIENFYNY